MAGNLAAIATSPALLDANTFTGLRLASVAGHLLWRAGAKFDTLDSLAEEQPGNCRVSSNGFADDFKQCSCPELVECKMSKIPAAGSDRIDAGLGKFA
jgi:hypothetical protein